MTIPRIGPKNFARSDKRIAFPPGKVAQPRERNGYLCYRYATGWNTCLLAALEIVTLTVVLAPAATASVLPAHRAFRPLSLGSRRAAGAQQTAHNPLHGVAKAGSWLIIQKTIRNYTQNHDSYTVFTKLLARANPPVCAGQASSRWVLETPCPGVGHDAVPWPSGNCRRKPARVAKKGQMPATVGKGPGTDRDGRSGEARRRDVWSGVNAPTAGFGPAQGKRPRKPCPRPSTSPRQPVFILKIRILG